MVDKPSQLSLNGRRIVVKQTFTQMACLIRLLPLIVGDLVPPGDEAWEVLLDFLQCLQLICARVLSPGQIAYLEDLLSSFGHKRRQVFNREDTPKHHYLYHYPKQMSRIWTYRFESKHNYFHT